MKRNHLLIAALSIALCAGGVAWHMSSADAAPSKKQFPAIGQPAKFKVLKTGKSPRTALRWAPTAGATGNVSFVMDIDTEIAMGETAIPVAMKMDMDMASKIESVAKDGTSVISMTVTDASMQMPGVPGDSSELRDMLKGLTITQTMDARGMTSGTKVTGGGAQAGQLAGQMDESLDQMAIPFPKKKLGVGAKWQALTTKESNGIAIRMVATYTLTKFDGKRGTVTIAIKQYGDRQTVSLNGINTEVKKLSGSGKGQMTFDLSSPASVTATLSMSMKAKMVIMNQEARMKMKAGMSLKPKP